MTHTSQIFENMVKIALDRNQEERVFLPAMKKIHKPVPTKVQFIPNPVDREILAAGRDKHGIKMTEVIRMALRRFAEYEGLKVS